MSSRLRNNFRRVYYTRRIWLLIILIYTRVAHILTSGGRNKCSSAFPGNGNLLLPYPFNITFRKGRKTHSDAIFRKSYRFFFSRFLAKSLMWDSWRAGGQWCRCCSCVPSVQRRCVRAYNISGSFFHTYLEKLKINGNNIER